MEKARKAKLVNVRSCETVTKPETGISLVLGQQLSDPALQLASFRFGGAKSPHPIERDWVGFPRSNETPVPLALAAPPDLR
jgi:hypothetical protein